MKIVYLNPSAQLGGAEAALFTLLSGLRRHRPDWTLELILTETGPLASRAEAIGVRVKVLKLPERPARLGDSAAGGPAGQELSRAGVIGRLLLSMPSLLLYVWRLGMALRAASPDIIHTNGLKMHLLAIPAKPRGAALVWHMHDYASARPLASFLLRRAARFCTAAATNSKSVASDLRNLCGDELNIVPIYNAVDLERFNPEGTALDLDALAGLPAAPDGTVRVGLVATMAKWKGHGVFLEALARLPASLPFRGYIAGGSLYPTEGSQSSPDALREDARRLGLHDRVGFTGFVEDSPALMRSLDVVVHASTRPEPFGLVIAEAMASGRPVVVSAAGGAAEIAALCAEVPVYPPGDVSGLAGLIEQLVSDRKKREAVGRDGRVCAERFFDHSRFSEEFSGFYESVSPEKDS